LKAASRDIASQTFAPYSQCKTSLRILVSYPLSWTEHLKSIDLNLDHFPAIHLAVSACLRQQFLGYHSLKRCMDGRERVGRVIGKVKSSGQKRLSHLDGRHPILFLSQNIAAAFGECFLNVRAAYLMIHHHFINSLHFFHRFGHIHSGFLHQFGRNFLSSCVQREALKRCLDAFQFAVRKTLSATQRKRENAATNSPKLHAFFDGMRRVGCRSRNPLAMIQRSTTVFKRDLLRPAFHRRSNTQRLMNAADRHYRFLCRRVSYCARGV